jgi:hypothetical protein
MVASNGYMFGQEDAINQRPHTSSAVCFSGQAIVYTITVTNFIQKLSKD